VIVVADTSVILNLALVGQEELLAVLFHKVFIPPAVQAEFSRLAASAGRFAGLGLPAWILVRQPAAIPERLIAHAELDRGEVEALALAVEMQADAVLIDESAGRAAALELGLTPVGVLGILVRAKRHGQLLAVAPVVEALLTRAHFRVAPELLREVLLMAGEAP
jgi:predicted nucleic acid-binding protein